MLRISTVAVAAITLGASVAPAQSIVHVDDDAPPGGDGASWSTAFATLQDALAVAQAGDEIRLAGGLHLPDRGGGRTAGDRDATFELDRVALVGGWRGLQGGGSADDRDPAAFVTILSGDLAQDDPLRGDNGRTIVTLSGDATLDGLVIEKAAHDAGTGVVDAGSFALTARDCEVRDNSTSGAGIWSAAGSLVLERCAFRAHADFAAGIHAVASSVSATDCDFEQNAYHSLVVHDSASTHLVRCAFRDNTPETPLLLADVAATIEECVFEDNFTPGRNGGAAQIHGSKTVSFRACRFSRNDAPGWESFGGAIFVGFAPIEVLDCLFEENHAGVTGGAIGPHGWPLIARDTTFVRNRTDVLGGAADVRSATFERCTFVENESGVGGALSVERTALLDCSFVGNRAREAAAMVVYYGDLEIARCTIAGNAATSSATGAIVVESGASLLLHDSIVFDNSRNGIEDEAAQLAGAIGSITIDRCCVEGWTGSLGGSGNFGSDPLFVDPTNGRFDLQLASPCVEAGDPAWSPVAGLERDVAGNARILDAQLDRTPRLDLGAYEHAHVRASWTGSPTPGGTVTIALDGTPGLCTLLFVGLTPAAWPLPPHGVLFVDLCSPYVVIPWSSPSTVDVVVPSGFPIPTTTYLQAFAFTGRAGNLSNSLAISVE